MRANYEKDFGDWFEILKPVLQSELMETTMRKVEEEYYTNVNKQVLPAYQHIFRAFRETPASKFRCLILGQDPYPTPGDATGVAFAAPETALRMPKSLKNLVEELERQEDTMNPDFDITLEHWTRQGVLLLNSSLTVIERKAGAHKEIWKPLMTSMIDHIIAAFPYHPVITFGNQAREMLSPYAKGLIYHLHSPHPAAALYGKSPGAVGSNVFVNANQILQNPDYKLSKGPIDWLFGYGFHKDSSEWSDAPF